MSVDHPIPFHKEEIVNIFHQYLGSAYHVIGSFPNAARSLLSKPSSTANKLYDIPPTEIQEMKNGI